MVCWVLSWRIRLSMLVQIRALCEATPDHTCLSDPPSHCGLSFPPPHRPHEDPLYAQSIRGPRQAWELCRTGGVEASGGEPAAEAAGNALGLALPLPNPFVAEDLELKPRPKEGVGSVRGGTQVDLYRTSVMESARGRPEIRSAKDSLKHDSVFPVVNVVAKSMLQVMTQSAGSCRDLPRDKKPRRTH